MKTPLAEPWKSMMSWPDHIGEWCPCCGTPVEAVYAGSHHMVPRSINPGWKEEPGPRVKFCGDGTRGCHGDMHARRIFVTNLDGIYLWRKRGGARWIRFR